MKLSIIIPTRGDQNMHNILACLQEQSFKDFEVIFVVDKILELGIRNQEFGVRYIYLEDEHYHNNASYLRNVGIKAAKGEFILLMDDDEQFADDYLEKTVSEWEKYRKLIKKDFVLTPTLMYRKTGQVQNYGFAHFDYWLSRPIPLQLHKAWGYIQMYSGNSLFAPAYIFQQHLFDERFDFVYEDLDFTYGIHRAGYPLIVVRDLQIFHMERDKTKLEQARVGNIYAAYRKAKHRMLFVRKYGSFRNKIQFYSFGFLGQPLWLIMKVLIYGKQVQRWQIIKAIVKGTFA